MSAHAEAALAAVRTELDRIAALRTVNRDETSPDRFSVGARWTIRLIRDTLGEQPFEAPAEMVDDELRHMAAADGTPPPVGETTQPAIVCICGSTRFMAEMAEADLRETAAGRIVVKPGCNLKTPHELWADPDQADALKARLDDLHRAKIRMADEVLVVGDYIGDSTRAEIAYARSLGKPVRFTHPQVDPDRGLPPTGNCTRHTGTERELYGCSGPDPADAPADRLPFLGDVDARARRIQASAAKLRGLLGGAS